MSDFLTIGTLPEQVEWQAALVLAYDAEGRALMHLRDDYPHIAAPGQWSLFGGHVEDGESLVEAAVREFQEETGVLLRAEELEPLAQFSSHTERAGLLSAFRATRPVAAQDICLQEGAGFGFLTARQLETYDLIPNIKLMFQELASDT